MIPQILVSLVVMAASAPANAADHSNLEHGLPITVADAQPVAFLGREFQSLVRYEAEPDGSRRAVFEPRFELGVAKNAQIAVAGPIRFGDEAAVGLGDLRFEGLYNLNAETIGLPAFAVLAEVEVPTAADSRRVDPSVGLIASKSLPGTWRWHRLHLNLQLGSLLELNEAQPGYLAVLGYTARAGNQWFLLADVVRERRAELDLIEHRVEAGARHQLTPRWVVSGGAGLVLADGDLGVRPTLGVQGAI